MDIVALLEEMVDATEWELEPRICLITGSIASGFENLVGEVFPVLQGVTVVLDNFVLYVLSFFVVTFSHLNRCPGLV